MRGYHGVFRDTESLYVGDAGGATANVRYVRLDGTSNQVVIADISGTGAPAGFARDDAGNLFVGDADDGAYPCSLLPSSMRPSCPAFRCRWQTAWRSTTSVRAAISHPSPSMPWGESAAAVVRPAFASTVRPFPCKRIWRRTPRTHRVAVSRDSKADGKSYVGCVSSLPGKTPQRFYGSDLSVFYLMTAFARTRLPPAIGGRERVRSRDSRVAWDRTAKARPGFRPGQAERHRTPTTS